MRSLLLLCLGAAAALAQAPLPASGTYKDCDPTIHDKLVGAEYRSPSECEVKFDTDLRQALTAALQPAIRALTAKGWVLDSSQRPLRPITGVGRHTEKNPFRPDFTDGRGFQVSLHLPPGHPDAARYAQMNEQAMQSFSAALASGNMQAAESAKAGIDKAARLVQGATTIRISIPVNHPLGEEFNFAPAHTALTVPGAAYAVRFPMAQSAGGGGADASLEASFVFLGVWATPAITHNSDGETIHLNARFNRAITPLAAQTLELRIEANAALADEVLHNMDFAPLNSLLKH